MIFIGAEMLFDIIGTLVRKEKYRKNLKNGIYG